MRRPAVGAGVDARAGERRADRGVQCGGAHGLRQRAGQRVHGQPEYDRHHPHQRRRGPGLGRDAADREHDADPGVRQAGNDRLSLSELNAPLPRANLFGASGDDILIGGAGEDQLFGQVGNDTLTGAAGNDFLFGGSENDTLVGGRGADQVFGDAGTDRLVWNPGDDRDALELRGREWLILNGKSHVLPS